MNTYTGSLILIVMGALFAGNAWSTQSQPEGSPEAEVQVDEESYFENLDDRFSYAYGIGLAEQFRSEGVELNLDIMIMAMQEVFSDHDRKMSSGEVAATIEIYQEIHRTRKEAERAVIAERNQQAGKAFLAENARKKGVVVTDSGLQYKVLAQGNSHRKPTEDDEVTVHYRAMLTDGTEFDSTHSRDETFTVEVYQLIDGWSEALQMMSEGDRWELYIPAELAYGEQGSDQYVEPNAVLIFEVELLGISQRS